MPLAGNSWGPAARWLGLGTLLTGALTLGVAPVAMAGSVPLVSPKPAPTVGFDGVVYASTHVGGTVYLGGNFTHAIVGGKPVARKRLAAVDARTGKLLPWAPLADDTVMAVTAAGSSLFATGEFGTVSGQPRAGLAAIDLRSGAVGPLRHTVRGTGQALAVGDGRLYLGGSFRGVDGRAVRNLAAFRLSDGALDGGFRGGADGKVRVLATAGDRLYAGGDFRGRLAALRLGDGRPDASFRPATPYPVMALTVNTGRVYAALAGPGGRVAAYRPDGSLAWSSVTDGDVQAITYLNGAVYAGGHFNVACPRPSRSATAWCPARLRSQPKLAAWNPATGALLDWNPHSNGRWGVLTLSINPATSAIAVGGDFTAFGGSDRARFAQFTS
ncbi:hypothetical protein GCM10010172_39830 [Paractinoplanes ferrugineus]|uniref:Uncharacterized protein n=1 Tax=Paractinoplanes ferrugineus TaxID=113564 RepID=A0A919JAE3_9ACTN|nr:hypothetical protein [Actinoplanes ferrugineus]GIE16018.1 hypothetical protein Afe05nite_78580 [Actinoplanes ferrugineus]